MWGHHFLGKRSIFKDSHRIIIEASSKISAAILVDFLTSSFSSRCRSVICHIGMEMVVGKVVDVICTRTENLSRDDFFIGLHIHELGHGNLSQSVDRVKYAIEDSLIQYADLLIIPWPTLTDADEGVPPKASKRLIERLECEQFLRTWEVFTPLVKAGKVKHLGVSTLKRSHLEYVLKKSSLAPSVNYVRITLTNQEQSLIRFCHQRGLDVITYLNTEDSDPDALQKVEKLTTDTGRSVIENLVIWMIQCGLQALPDINSILAPWDPSTGEEFDTWRQKLVSRANHLFLLLHPLGQRPESYAPNSGYTHDLTKAQMTSIADLDMQSKIQKATPAPAFRRRLPRSSMATPVSSSRGSAESSSIQQKVADVYSLDLEQASEDLLPSARSEKGHGGYAVKLSGIDDLYKRPQSQPRPRIENVKGFMPEFSVKSGSGTKHSETLTSDGSLTNLTLEEANGSTVSNPEPDGQSQDTLLTTPSKQKLSGITKHPTSAPSQVAGDAQIGYVQDREASSPMPVPVSSRTRPGTTDTIPMTPGSPDLDIKVGPISGIAGRKTSAHQAATVEQLQGFMPPLVVVSQSQGKYPEPNPLGRQNSNQSSTTQSSFRSSEMDLSIGSITGYAGKKMGGHEKASTEKLQGFMPPTVFEVSPATEEMNDSKKHRNSSHLGSSSSEYSSDGSENTDHCILR